MSDARWRDIGEAALMYVACERLFALADEDRDLAMSDRNAVAKMVQSRFEKLREVCNGNRMPIRIEKEP